VEQWQVTAKIETSPIRQSHRVADGWVSSLKVAGPCISRRGPLTT